MPELLSKRCRHVITENEQTLAAAGALEHGDFAQFGRLMLASIAPSRSTTKKIELPRARCRGRRRGIGIPGVYGARMTGGGFGGYTVDLRRQMPSVRCPTHFDKSLRRRFHKKPDIFASRASEGAMERHELAAHASPRGRWTPAAGGVHPSKTLKVKFVSVLGVVGGAGYIGSHTAKAVAQCGRSCRWCSTTWSTATGGR